MEKYITICIIINQKIKFWKPTFSSKNIWFGCTSLQPISYIVPLPKNMRKFTFNKRGQSFNFLDQNQYAP